jgi:hypothetical protein
MIETGGVAIDRHEAASVQGACPLPRQRLGAPTARLGRASRSPPLRIRRSALREGLVVQSNVVEKAVLAVAEMAISINPAAEI